MKRLMKFLHMIGAIGPMGAMACLLVLLGFATSRHRVMVVLDPATGLYNADATPSFGADTLFDFYARVINGTAAVERGRTFLKLRPLELGRATPKADFLSRC